jgi:putative ABC transport system permease protein
MSLLRLWRVLRRRRANEAIFREELSAHLQALEERYRAEGLSVEAARTAARRQFGNVTTVTEDVREEFRLGGVEWLARDVRYAARTLRASPGFTLMAAGSLALGIGGSIAVFTLLNAVVLRSLPIHEPDRVFQALRASGDEMVGRLAWPAIQRAQNDLAGRAEIAAVSRIAAMPLEPEGRGAGQAERGAVQLVSGEYFDLLRQRPQRGRLLTGSDNVTVGAHPVAVISDAYWRRRLAASETAVGSHLTINGSGFTVIGIAEPQFFGTTLTLRSPDVWIPLVMQPVVRYAQNASSHDGADAGRPWPPQETIEWLTAFVRVPRATDPAAIAASLTVQRQREAVTLFSGGSFGNMRNIVQNERILLEPASRGLSPFRDTTSSSLFVLMAMMGVLLAVACANVAGLLIARASAREREIAVRLSIGAGRMQVVRQMLTESLLLGVAAGAAGVVLAFWSRSALLRMFAPTASLITLDIGFDARVFTFAIGVSMATGVACGIFPAVRGTRGSVADALKAQTPATSGGRRSLFVGQALVALQMAFCLLALVVAALFVRSLQLLTSMDIGYDREHVVTASLDLRTLRYTAEQRQALYERVLERMRRIPGVTSASLSMNGPLAGAEAIIDFGIEGYTPRHGERLTSHAEVVTEDYFGTVGLRLLQGRLFGPADHAPGNRNTIVNDAIARRFFKNGDAIGKRWGLGSPVGPDGFVIVGVVQDAKYVDLRTPPPNMVYHLAAAQPDRVLSDLEIRTAGSPTTMTATVRQVLADSEPRLSVDVMPLRDRMAQRVSPDTLIARLTSIFSAIALFLAGLGLYGTISYGINRRVPEIGLRMALGADRRSVLRLILREALLVVGLGAIVGIPLAYIAGRSLRTMLYEIPPLDPTSYGGAAIVLIAVSLLAAFLPARRASRIEPMLALNRS